MDRLVENEQICLHLLFLRSSKKSSLVAELFPFLVAGRWSLSYFHFSSLVAGR
jgi:hypothetical protein